MKTIYFSSITMRATLAMLAVFVSFLLSTALTSTAYARTIEGSISIPQFGEPPKELRQKIGVEAAAAFREELHLWLREKMHIDVDTVSTIKKYAFDQLAKRCLEAAKETNTVRGRVWTLALVVDESDAENALRAHNAHFEAQASEQFLSARGNDPVSALPGAIGALCAVMSKIEPAGAKSGINADEIRATVQILFDKMEVKIAGTVIEGRQGALPQKFPEAVMTFDGKPLADFHLTAFVQNGRQFARIATNSAGGISLKNYKMPFVHNGSMLTVSPDARTFIRADHFIRFKDLGVKLNKGQEMTFIYKLPTLTYKLEYKALTREKDLKIPGDFSSDAHVKKYLKDICGLAPGGASADLNIKIGVEVAKVSYNDTEEDAILTKMRVEIRGSGGIDKSGQSVFEKRYQFGINVQMGEYFWAASKGLKDFIAETLAKD